MPLDEQPEHYSANLRTDRRPFVAPDIGLEPITSTLTGLSPFL